MSRRKNESPAQYSARMSAYQKARRDGVKPESARATREVMPPAPRRVSVFRLRHLLAADEKRLVATERRRRVSIATAPAVCYGDVLREQLAAAGKVGAPKHASSDRLAEDARRSLDAARFKATILPLIVPGAVTTARDLIAGIELPPEISPDRAMMLVTALFKAIGAERAGAEARFRWRMPNERLLTIARAAGETADASKIQSGTKPPGSRKATQRAPNEESNHLIEPRKMLLTSNG